ncbi:hypothetical protein [Aquifex sp.]
MLKLSSSIKSASSGEEPKERVKNFLFNWLSKRGYQAELRWIAENVEDKGIHIVFFVKNLTDEMKALKLSREAERALRQEGIESVIVSLYPYHYKLRRRKSKYRGEEVRKKQPPHPKIKPN